MNRKSGLLFHLVFKGNLQWGFSFPYPPKFNHKQNLIIKFNCHGKENTYLRNYKPLSQKLADSKPSTPQFTKLLIKIVKVNKMNKNLLLK